MMIEDQVLNKSIDLPLRIIYIVGSGHCGSTLLDRLLAAHPEVFGGGELVAINEYKDRDTLPSVWKDILNTYSVKEHLGVIRSKWAAIRDIQAYRRVKNNESVTKEMIAFEAKELYMKIAAHTGATVIVDSSKDVSRAECVASIDEVDVLYVHLIRDPQGVMWSYYKKYPEYIFFFATKWLFSLIKAHLFVCRTDRRVLMMQYESLVADPEKSVNVILESARLSVLQNVVDTANQTQVTQVRGNRMKHSEIVVRKDESYRNAPVFIRLFSAIFLYPWYYLYTRI